VIEEKGCRYIHHPLNKGGNLMNSKKSVFWAMILVVAILVLPALGASAKEKGSSAVPETEALSKLSKLHIPFISNRGQVDERVKYYARTFGGTVFVSEAGEIFYSLPKREGEEKTLRGWVLKEELLGGSIKEVKAEGEASTRVSYFIGNDASRWRSDILTYGSVSFGEVYEGIEVKVKAYGKNVEKLFYVRAGAKPSGGSGLTTVQVMVHGVTECRLRPQIRPLLWLPPRSPLPGGPTILHRPTRGTLSLMQHGISSGSVIRQAIRLTSGIQLQRPGALMV
jgi:hypothetical protein